MIADGALGEAGGRTLAHFPTDQIEFANVAVLNSPEPRMIRAKGHFWIATQADWVAEFSLSSVKPLGT